MNQPRPENEFGTMSFGDHLEELRTRMLLALAAPLPVAIVAFFFAEDILRWLCQPLFAALRERDLPAMLQVLGPAETIMTHLKISVVTALVISAPWILWQAWRFVQPGLYRHERRFVYFLLPGSGVLTAAGVLLYYYVMLPLVLAVLVGFGASMDLLPATPEAASEPPVAIDLPLLPVLTQHPAAPAVGSMWIVGGAVFIAVPGAPTGEDGAPEIEIRRVPLGSDGVIAQQFQLTNYVGFVLLFGLGTVLAFQMPLVVLLLGWLNLVTVDWLRAHRKYAIFVCAVIAAVLTPPDPWSMVAMLVPLYLLYELGMVLLRVAPASRVASGAVFSRRAAPPAKAARPSKIDPLATDSDGRAPQIPPRPDDDPGPRP
jgi:sec-independent protein translocase protein TatC